MKNVMTSTEIIFFISNKTLVIFFKAQQWYNNQRFETNKSHNSQTRNESINLFNRVVQTFLNECKIKHSKSVR